MLILAAMDRKEQNAGRVGCQYLKKRQVYSSLLQLVLCLSEPRCFSLTLTLPSRNTFLFSLLFIFGTASANIWSQILLTEKRKNDAVCVRQQDLYQKTVWKVNQTIYGLCQTLSNVTLTCFLFCFAFPNCFEVCQCLADLQKPRAKRRCNSICNPPPWVTLRAVLAELRVEIFLFWGCYWSLYRHILPTVYVHSWRKGLGINQFIQHHISAF